MKTIKFFAAFIFLFQFMLSAQEETAIKNNSNSRTDRQEIVYEPPTQPMLVNDFNDGGGSYSSYFYYGDPSGMFLSEAWLEGTALLKDGTEMLGTFRYNIYRQKMQCIVEGDTFAFAKPCELEWVMIEESRFIYSTFVRNDFEVSNSWFEVLSDGNYELLLRRYIKYRVTDGDDDHSNDQLYKLEEYYTRDEDGDPERLYVSKKSLLEAMKDHDEEVEAFMKAEKIKLKEQKDLVKLFAYYNSL